MNSTDCSKILFFTLDIPVDESLLCVDEFPTVAEEVVARFVLVVESLVICGFVAVSGRTVTTPSPPS